MIELRIKELCKAKGITQKELAANIGITSVGLSKAINGNPTLHTLKSIAKALDVPFLELFNTPEKGNSFALCPHCGRPIKIEKALPKPTFK